jgi:uncharacterized membrane protein
MRVERTIEIEAPVARVWEAVKDLEDARSFLSGMTVWEREDGSPKGMGERLQIRMHVGSADIGGLVEVVEWDPLRDVAWTSITGIDQRGRLRLRETDDGQTKVALRWSYKAPGGLLGLLSDYIGSPVVGKHLSQSLENLKRQVEAKGAADG